MEIVKTRTEDGILLKGLYASSGSDKIALIIPGINGNFIDNDFLVNICKKLSNNGFDCLCANTRDSFNINTSVYPNNALKPKKIGTVYTVFEDCIYDIDAWINYIMKLGFEKVNLISHCTGANKIIYYYNSGNENIKAINNIILISPASIMFKIKNYSNYTELVEEAIENVKNNFPDKLVNVHIFYKTSSCFLKMIRSNNINNLPLENGKLEEFEQFNNIVNNISVIYGSDDKYVAPFISRIIEVANYETNIKLNVVDGADHLFIGKEEEVADAVSLELKRMYNIENKIKIIRR